jgi:hypothetical protein
MYSILRERNQLKDIAQQLVLLAISGFVTEKIVEILVKERGIFPESFALESFVFLATWFGLDLFACSILRSNSFLKSLNNRVVAKRCLITLVIAWITAILFFRFYSFTLELSAMLVLWFLLDFLLERIRQNTH